MGRLGTDVLGAKAWFCLGLLGPTAETIVPELVDIAEDTNAPQRFLAMSLLARIHSHPDIAVPVLEKALEGSNFSVVITSALGLGEFGPAAKSAVPALLAKWRRLKNEAESVQQKGGFPKPTLLECGAIAHAVRQIDPEAAEKAGIK
jgi:HEAT repeat protein